MTKMNFWVGAAVTAGWALGAQPLGAEVLQTGDGTPLPQPVSANELNLSKDLGWAADRQIYKDFDGTDIFPAKVYTDFFPNFVTGDAITLSGLFKWRGEMIDPAADARTAPGYFSPTCGFSGELVLRGGNCNVSFGWYNVLDPENPQKPTEAEIYELIPSNTEEYMQCMTQSGSLQPEGTGFCPLGWDNHHPYNLAQTAWIPKAFDSGVISSDPRYLGKHVAFALIGNPNIQCKQTKFSIAQHNTPSPSGEPWITTLIWQSTVDPEGFYLGFEDLPMTEQSWKNPGAGAIGENDGDFNDFVYFITGLNCVGGGQPCDTGLVGACSLGRTDCAVDGMAPTCRAIISPGPELCDNVDNNCDGEVDNADGLCPDDLVCDQGSCVKPCSSGEFPCPTDMTCGSKGMCIETACATVECPAGQACRGGTCRNACDGVTCPAGQECQLGRCIDPCAAVECPEGRVCERGLCVSNCQCRGCPDGLECGADGRCSDPACVGKTCPEGLTCRLGECVDPCEGVSCPGGAECVDGNCLDPSGLIVEEDDDTPLLDPLETDGTTSRTTEQSAQDAAERAKANEPSCGCRVARPTGSAYVAVGALGVALLMVRRRRYS